MATPWRALGGNCRALFSAVKSSAAATSAASKAAKPAKGTSSPAAASPAPALKGILKPVPVSVQLGEFLGSSEASRTEAVKKIWDHIKAHNLQDPSNKKEILCDEKLKTIFGKDKVGFLEITSLLSPHFVKSG